MDIRVPLKVVYQINKAPPVADVVASLLAAEQLLRFSGPILEDIFPELKVDHIDVSVGEISEGSLKEILFVSLFVVFQKDLERDVPLAIEKLTRTHIPSEYNSIVTVLFALVLFYGADFIYSQINRGAFSKRIRFQLEAVVKELSGECGLSEERIKQVLEVHFAKSRMKILASSALNFFSPSKRCENAPILISDVRLIERELVQDIPSEAQIEEAEVPEIVKQYQNVKIELHAQDLDRSRSGWAAIVPNIVPKRVRMEIAPPIRPEDIYAKKLITGDVAVVFQKKSDGSYKPAMLHLMHLKK